MLKDHFKESAKLISQSTRILEMPIAKASDLIVNAFNSGNKLLVCGNGGSAAESQHMAAELTGRYLKERKALPAIALTTDTSALTAIGNDYHFDQVFSRQIQALGSPGDVLLCMSTSGNSANVIKAAKQALTQKIKVIILSGNSGGKLKKYSDVNIIVPSKSTPLIQEVHLVVIHILCDLLESSFL